LFQANPSNPAIPVIVTDCYLDQNSYIQTDDIQDLMPSITSFKGSLATGISASFNRNLVTGDTKDITLYSNSVIQVCFISSTQPFVGNGFEKGNEKDCTYISIHKNVNYYYQDRLLGSFAATTTFGGGNVTFYATESTDGGTFESWLFFSVVHKAQGLSPFVARQLAVAYSQGLVNNDMAIIQYNTVNNKLDLHISDNFITNSSFANFDSSYVINQGGDDITTIMTAYDPNLYVVASYKRKFSTGDINRDIVVNSGDNIFCLYYGNSLAFTTAFSYSDYTCLGFHLTTQYSTNFRETTSG
jgi:hypothetical protein